MTLPMEMVRQHVIDPELCVRCNTCEETCTSGAVSHDQRNYAVDASLCNACMNCVAFCPTGAIDNWVLVPDGDTYSINQQFSWTSLPDAGPAAAPETLHSLGNNPIRHAANDHVQPAVERPHSLHHPAIGRIVGNKPLTAAECATDIRQMTIDMSAQDFPYKEGQSIGVVPPGRDADGSPHRMRLYSLASSRNGESGIPGRISIVVKRVVSEQDGRLIPGVCSNYICDSKTGDQIAITGPFGADFLMPRDDQAPLILICTGTGIAPMRAMIEQRRQLPDPGQMIVFYGGRSPDEMAYSAELEELARARPAMLTVAMAYSRLPDRPKMYVHDLISHYQDMVSKMLFDPRCHIYLCGLKGMESGVFEAFKAICENLAAEWPALHDCLKSEARLHIETY